MFIIIFNLPKVIPTRRTLVIGLIVIVGIVVIASFVWMQMDQVIAPPGLRMLDWLWRMFRIN